MTDQTELNLRDVDFYNVYNCAICAHPYQMPVRQWKGEREEVLPAMNCVSCANYCWMKVGRTDVLQVRKQFVSSWQSNPTTNISKNTIMNITLIGATAATAFMSTLMPHLTR